MDLSKLSEHLKGKLSDDRIQIGSVFRMMALDTTPPKYKYFIVVGFTDDKIALGSVYINSEINPNIFKSERLKSLHLPISPDTYPFLSHNSFVDCSQIRSKNVSDIEIAFKSAAESPFFGNLLVGDIKQIIDTLHTSPTISEIELGKYGLKSPKQE